MRFSDHLIPITSLFDKRGPLILVDSIQSEPRSSFAPTYLLLYPLSIESKSEQLREQLEEQTGAHFRAAGVMRLSDVVVGTFLNRTEAIFLHSDITDLEWFLIECRRKNFAPAIYILANELPASTLTRYLDLGVRGCYDLSTLEVLSSIFSDSLAGDPAA